MRAGISVPNFGPFADHEVIADLAVTAESTGWDGFFLWDHLDRAGSPDVADPWILLTVVATRTKHLRLGPLVTPLARRRPWQVARETVTLDQVSGGRLILGVGLGGGNAETERLEFAAFGDESTLRQRAGRLDDGLRVLADLWSGETVTSHGEHYQVDGVRFLPRPVQRPRIPVWVGGVWPRRRPLRRAAQWDAYVPVGGWPYGVEDVVGMRRELPDHVALVLTGQTSPEDAAHVRSLADAGATWWIEHPLPEQHSPDDVRRRLLAGPPTGADGLSGACGGMRGRPR